MDKPCDDAVAQARNQLTTEQKQPKRKDLEKLFDSHVAILKDRDTLEQIVEFLRNQKGRVLAKASEMTFGYGNIPFLPVILRTLRSPYDFMGRAQSGGEVGYTSNELYYIYDVDAGNTTRGNSSENAEKIPKQQKRSPLTGSEVMALHVYTVGLSNYYGWSPGSPRDNALGMPLVCPW